jgi:hypothetical protein
MVDAIGDEVKSEERRPISTAGAPPSPGRHLG